ncbi:hypothetical protein IMG5_003350 [Ichthyophthirius multifiliis]|uniref:Uncharacterized protein n=1 Tax=Ichthyophthirius multifiliis TaxID=5932 RepID=G0QJ93_ICHMU|nr:hypothetical protein IMG5_003350 [Ichthyophthirius multifiliis]EGR34702.1 hypothetical protein IMG5_003350 [Ichthyophthirius multifiliis]|eukprot:XP_004040006.1 hypothetical protein IMG5_003350 [Ichthyophthirius multifiliis]
MLQDLQIISNILILIIQFQSIVQIKILINYQKQENLLKKMKLFHILNNSLMVQKVYMSLKQYTESKIKKIRQKNNNKLVQNVQIFLQKIQYGKQRIQDLQKALQEQIQLKQFQELLQQWLQKQWKNDNMDQKLMYIVQELFSIKYYIVIILLKEEMKQSYQIILEKEDQLQKLIYNKYQMK